MIRPPVDRGSVSQRGKFWNLEHVRLMPRAVQKPHPPIWIAAISAEESFLYAAQNGFHLMIVPYAGKPGRSRVREALSQGVGRVRPTSPAPSRSRWRQLLRGRRARAPRTAASSASASATSKPSPTPATPWQGRSSDQYPGYDKMVASIMATTRRRSWPAAGRSSARPTRWSRRCARAWRPSARSSPRCRSTSAARRTAKPFAPSSFSRHG